MPFLFASTICQRHQLAHEVHIISFFITSFRASFTLLSTFCIILSLFNTSRRPDSNTGPTTARRERGGIGQRAGVRRGTTQHRHGFRSYGQFIFFFQREEGVGGDPYRPDWDLGCAEIDF